MDEPVLTQLQCMYLIIIEVAILVEAAEANLTTIYDGRFHAGTAL